MHAMRLLMTIALSLSFGASVEAQWWEVQTSGIDTNLRGVSATYVHGADGEPVPVVWVSGSNGVILQSEDEGRTWQRLHVDGGDRLDFRGIISFNAYDAYVMSSGEGEKSRIYKTTDGGKTWKLQYTDTRKEFFLDALGCWSPDKCLALGDPVDGKFLLLFTADGEHWSQLPGDKMPAALPGEGAFAASNTGLISGTEDTAFGTGGTRAARYFHSFDLGLTWTVVETPIAGGRPSAGIFSLGLGEHNEIIAMGGDYKEPISTDHVAAYSFDGGKTWKTAAQQPRGYRSAVAHLDGAKWVAVGPSGADISDDSGVHWKHTDSLNLNAVAILDPKHGWAVGPKGTVARFVDRAIPYRRSRGKRPATPQPAPPVAH